MKICVKQGERKMEPVIGVKHVYKKNGRHILTLDYWQIITPISSDQCVLFFLFSIVYREWWTTTTTMTTTTKKRRYRRMTKHMALCQMCRGNKYLKNFKYFGACHIVSTFLTVDLLTLLFALLFELLFPTLPLLCIFSLLVVFIYSFFFMLALSPSFALYLARSLNILNKTTFMGWLCLFSQI